MLQKHTMIANFHPRRAVALLGLAGGIMLSALIGFGLYA